MALHCWAQLWWDSVPDFTCQPCLNIKSSRPSNQRAASVNPFVHTLFHKTFTWRNVKEYLSIEEDSLKPTPSNMSDCKVGQFFVESYTRLAEICTRNSESLLECTTFLWELPFYYAWYVLSFEDYGRKELLPGERFCVSFATTTAPNLFLWPFSIGGPVSNCSFNWFNWICFCTCRFLCDAWDEAFPVFLPGPGGRAPFQVWLGLSLALTTGSLIYNLGTCK